MIISSEYFLTDPFPKLYANSCRLEESQLDTHFVSFRTNKLKVPIKGRGQSLFFPKNPHPLLSAGYNPMAFSLLLEGWCLLTGELLGGQEPEGETQSGRREYQAAAAACGLRSRALARATKRGAP